MKNIRSAMILLFFAAPLFGAIAHVQSKACGVLTSGPSSCAFDGPVTAGSLLIVPCAGSRTGAALNVTDDNGNHYSLINGTTTTTDPRNGSTGIYGIWFATNVAAGFTTVTCTDANSNTTWLVNPIHEYSGVALSNAFDVGSSSQAADVLSTTTVVSGYLTTNRNEELIFGFAPFLAAPITAGNGTIRINGAVSDFLATEDTILATAGIYQSSFTMTNGSYVNNMAQAAFFPPLPAPKGVETWQ